MRREEEIIRDSLRSHGYQYFNPQKRRPNVWLYVVAAIVVAQVAGTLWALPPTAEDFKTGLSLGTYVDYSADFSGLIPGFAYRPKTKAVAAWYYRSKEAPEFGFHFVVRRHKVISLFVTSSSAMFEPPPDVARLSTKRGIHLGSRRIDVLARYGFPLIFDAKTQRLGYTLMSYRFPSSILTYIIDDRGLVSEMSLTDAHWGYPR